MNKLFCALIATAALFAVSCSSDDNGGGAEKLTEDKFAKRIHKLVDDQNMIICMDPAMVAFRFNTLLATAMEQDVNISQVKVTPKHLGKETLLKDYFFHMNKITENKDDNGESTGTWTISFNKIYYNSTISDVARIGEVTIDTKSKLLEELNNGESWDITFKDSDKGNFYAHYYYPISNIIDFNNDYTITKRGDSSTGSWDIRGKSRAYIDGRDDSKANWNFSLNITKDGTPGQAYEEAVASIYSMTGTAGGRPMNIDNYSDGYTYDITSPVRFNTSCVPHKVIDGACKIGLVEKDLKSAGISTTEDQRELSVRYESASNNCDYTTKITFKGKTYTK